MFLAIGRLAKGERITEAHPRNAAHAAFTIVKEEGIMTLYRGVTLTALRQATNQGKSP
jgi:hypothetical protein